MGDSSLLALVVPWAVPAGLVAVWALCWWGLLFPRALVWLLSITLILGQVIRLPLPGQGGGLLPSDGVAFLLVVTLGAQVVRKSIRPELAVLGSLMAAFLLFVLGRAFISMGTLLDGQGFLVAFAYWARLAVYALLLPLLMQSARHSAAFATTLRRSFLTAVVVTAVVGLLQLVFIPNLADVGLSGWDPHENRLVSTWLDPNLLGLFFVIALPYLGLMYVQTKHTTYLACIALLILALLGTASRSSFIAAASFLGVCWVFVLAHRKKLSSTAAAAVLFCQIMIVLCATLVVALFPARFSGLITADATVKLRQESLQQVVMRLIEPNSITGVGYNAYQYAAQREGLIGNFSIHSRSGADSSIATLWVTSGAVGLLLCGLILTYTWVCVTQKQAAGILAASMAMFTAVLVHSQFVNSALYGHLILGSVMLIAMLYTHTYHKLYVH